jgi:primosomal protein N'
MRVAVPFGKSKIYTALVVELHQRAPLLYEAKEIHQILMKNQSSMKSKSSIGNGLLPITCVP